MNFTTIEEIIAHAIEREETAYRLYLDAAAKSSSIASRKMFEEMAAEEKGHKEVFSRVDLATAVQKASAGVPDLQLSRYLVEVPLRPDMSYDEILRYAVKTEEAAAGLYRAAAEMTGDPGLKRTLLVFADVEEGHKKKVEALYDEHVLTEM